MALKELRKPMLQKPAQVEKNVEKFISKGGTLAEAEDIKVSDDGDHRLTLRIPKWLMDKVDEKRKERVGKISRNLWILEIIEKEIDAF
jgi:hypothetical protein